MPRARRLSHQRRGLRIFHLRRRETFFPGSIEGSEHTISLHSLSKAYGFASWRVGWMVIPEHLFEAVNKIQDTILICPPVVSQFAAAGAACVGAGYCRAQVEGWPQSARWS